MTCKEKGKIRNRYNKVPHLNQNINNASIEEPDQSRHQLSLVRLLTVRLKKALVGLAYSKCSDQTGLIRVFAVCACTHFVGFCYVIACVFHLRAQNL